MSAIPIHLERRFEQKWAARFGPLLGPLPVCRRRIEDRCGESHGSNGNGPPQRAAKAQTKTRRCETGELAYQPSAHPEVFRGSFAAVFLLFIAHFSTLIEVAQASSFHG
jgi:hypothetical protein